MYDWGGGGGGGVGRLSKCVQLSSFSSSSSNH